MTLDAAVCQTELVGQIREQGRNCLVAVKGNLPTLQAADARVFAEACDVAFARC